MPDYQFQLRHQDLSPSISEPVCADDDDEARALAEIRLLMTRGVCALAVWRGGRQILVVERDAPNRPTLPRLP